MWVHSVVTSIQKHKEDPATVAARDRSGSSYGQHGLTEQQVADRWERDDARRNYHWALGLEWQLLVSKGKAKGSKGEGKGKGKVPRAWANMSSRALVARGTLEWQPGEADEGCGAAAWR